MSHIKFRYTTSCFNVVLFVVPRPSDDNCLVVSQPKEAVHQTKTVNPDKASPPKYCNSYVFSKTGP